MPNRRRDMDPAAILDGQEIDREILSMLQSKEDPPPRAQLLLLLKMSNNLTENTTLTRNIATAFTAHEDTVTKYMENGNQMLNRGIGAWKVLGVVSLAAWTLAGVWIKGVSDGAETEKLTNAKQDVAIAEIRGDVRRLQDVLNEHLRQATPLMQDLQRERGIKP